MLSKKSETFIDNLRMYLMMSGKNEREITELLDELTDHLMEAEKNGKSIDDIVDRSPEHYMASLKQEMKTDYKQLLKQLPFYFLGVIAYFLMGPAIRGDFELNIIQVIGLPILAVLGLAIYVYFLQQAGRKQYSNKKFIISGILANTLVTLSAILILLASKFLVKPFYIGDHTADVIVILICCCIFFTTAIRNKTWLPIWLPIMLFIPDVFARFTNWSVETILVITIVSFEMIFVVIFLNLFMIEKRKNSVV
ncbi:HAAS domain-containing protein [Ferdinandcohnia sp. Marseille-Q9671]